jgi:hypothetical protein
MWIALLVLLLSAHAAPCSDAPELETLRALGYQAYRDGKFADAATMFEQAAAAATGTSVAGDLYNAACCRALAGDVDAAFGLLERAVDAGYRNRANLLGDSDLRTLRSDARFDSLLRRVDEPDIVITDEVERVADRARFVFDDIDHFIHAMDMVAAGAPLVPTLEREYFGRASPGLEQLVVKYPFTAEELARAIEQHPADYYRIPAIADEIRARVDVYRAAYGRFADVVPGVVFPPTYFLVGRHRGIGSGSPVGQLITIERKTDASIKHLDTLLVHELTHFQQLVSVGPDEFYALFGSKKSLLGLTIREGAAEYVADRVTGRMTQENARGYVIEHEPELWSRFEPAMLSPDTGEWMWSEPSSPEQPRDVAYVIGARIVQAYVDGAPDPHDALRKVFEVVDPESLLLDSGYAEGLAIAASPSDASR